jgi:RNA polymerase sigma-70 factor (ECF subfamily)
MDDVKQTAIVQSMEDNELVKRFQAGQVAAFNQLVIQYQHKIYQLTYSFVHNREDALDLSQEAFLKAFVALRRFKQKSAFYSWLHRITMNVCIDFLRSRRNVKSISLDTETASSYNVLSQERRYSPTKNIEQKELREHILNAISALAPKQREVFVLRHWEGLLIKEIAVLIGRSEGTVKTHLFHATKNLRKHLLDYIDLDDG